jgi:hypothetical protein
MISVAGGGVSIDVDEALRVEHLATVDAGKFDDSRKAMTPQDAEARWWWD